MDTTGHKPAEVKRPVEPHNFIHDGTEVLIVRRCDKGRLGKYGFQYPNVGEAVEAPEKWWRPDFAQPIELKLGWSADASCGGGLHGWPWGFGIGDGSNILGQDEVWLVIAAKPEDIVGNIDGGWKCKFRRGVVRYEGHFAGALAIVRDGFHACICEMARSDSDGHSATSAQSGDYAKSAQSGDSATSAQSGHSATSAQSGDSATSAQSGRSAKSAQSGDSATSAQSGHSATSAQSGDSATSAQSGRSATSAQSGRSATSAQSGHYAKSAQSGDSATSAQSGDDCIAAIVGRNGRCKTGSRGCFALAHWDKSTGWEILVGKVGRDGIKADTWYEVKDGKLMEAAS